MGKFGKEIQSSQIPGWSAFYLDYKGLKKIVSSLESALDAATQSSVPQAPLSPAAILNAPSAVAVTHPGSALPPDAPVPLSVSSAFDDDRGPVFQSYRASFFFKLERELEKVRPAALS